MRCHERIYDYFAQADLDPDLWRIARVGDRHGVYRTYRDRNSRVRVEHGQVHIAVDPFTRFDDVDPVRNNAKHLVLSTERIATVPDRPTTFAIDMAVRTRGQVPFDPLDAYGTANLVDFATGTVVNFAASNDTVFVVHEQLARATGGAGATPFLHRVLVDVDTGPGAEHHYEVMYRPDTPELTWWVDGEAVYRARAARPVEGFHVGMGLFSSRSPARYRRCERERGQGAEGWWGPWRVRQDRT